MKTVQGVRDTLLTRWMTLAARERFLALVMLALLALFVWKTGVHDPLMSAADSERERIERIETARLQLGALDASVFAGSGAAAVPLRQSLTASAAASGLGLQSIEGEGNRIELAFERVAFDALTDWLAAINLERGAVVTQARLTRQPEPGIVDAVLTVEE